MDSITLCKTTWVGYGRLVADVLAYIPAGWVIRGRLDLMHCTGIGLLQWRRLCAEGLPPLTALHRAGLVALTHTPSPMVREVLKRPDNETACLLIPVGHPAADARVPDLRRKPLEDILQILRE